MSKLWACEATKWGPLLFVKDADETFEIACSCTHPHSLRLHGRTEIVTSLVLKLLWALVLPLMQIGSNATDVCFLDLISSFVLFHGHEVGIESS